MRGGGHYKYFPPHKSHIRRELKFCRHVLKIICCVFLPLPLYRFPSVDL